jgi:hypothetical protein
MLNICHPVLIVAFCLLTGAVSSPALAQTVPPPPVPQLADEPLPEWTPPRHKPVDVLHLDTSPEANRAQALRQAGLWFASFGGVAMFTGGILYAYALDINGTLSHPHTDIELGDPYTIGVGQSATFDPRLEDRRNRVEAASFSLLAVGGACLVTGFTLFGIGQYKLREQHRQHPKDPLPPLSGFDH